MGGETPDHDHARRDDLRGQIGQGETVDQQMHEGPGEAEPTPATAAKRQPASRSERLRGEDVGAAEGIRDKAAAT